MKSLLYLAAFVVIGCNRTSTTSEGPSTPSRIGSAAPDFELPDLDGKRHKLSAHRGKIVVLEWFNPECPFVNKAHTVGSLKETPRRHMEKGVVWFAINSNAAGKQGHGAEQNRAGAERFGMRHPILLDESGRVGRAYGAKTTPHMFVIDQTGKLVYAGAIDNSPDGEGESPTGDRLINHVEEALAALAADRPIAPSSTEPYGCSVKYEN